jgi:hypothetical protein
MPPINRREALKATTAALGAVLFTADGVLTACGSEPRESREASKPSAAAPRALSADDQALAEEIADTLLPTTPASPGAKAAGAGAAMNLLVTDCYEPEKQRRVVAGLEEFRATCRARHRADFASLAPRAREQFLREVDAEAQKAGATHYFPLLRDLALSAYFTSEIGMTKALRYVQTPGRWVGCMPLKPGQPAWG